MATALDLAKQKYKTGTLEEENRKKLLALTKKNIQQAGSREAGLETTKSQLGQVEMPTTTGTTGLPKKQDLSSMIGAKGYEEGQVGIPGVNVMTKEKVPEVGGRTSLGDIAPMEEEPKITEEIKAPEEKLEEIKEDATGMTLDDLNNKLTELQNKQKEEGLKAEDYRAIQDQIEYYQQRKTDIERTQKDQARSAEMSKITGEIEDIQSSARIKNAKNQLNALKQNIGYIGTMGSPGVSQQKLGAMETQITDAEKVYSDLVRVEGLYKQARALGKEASAEQYERQLEDLQNDLNDKVNQTIQDALSNLTQKEISQVIEDPEEMENIRLDLLNQLDKDIASITEANFRKRQYVIDNMTSIISDIQTKEANRQKINSDLSMINGYYTDMNGDPIISATTGQRINIPTEAPMEPVFDKAKGQLITFAYDENGNIVANVDQIIDSATFEEKTLSNYANLYANGRLSISDMQNMGLTEQQIANVVGQSAEITPTVTEEVPKVERIGTDEEGNPIYGTYNPQTGKYEPISPTAKEEFTGDYATLDFSTNQELINKYPLEASFKNNNPTGITWGISDNLKSMFDKAGVSYSIGTARPTAEGGNYIKFDSVQDGLDAYYIALTQAGSDTVFDRLQQWVGTTNVNTNIAYAKELMEKAGLAPNAKFSELSEAQLGLLMDAQLQKESPAFYNELANLPTVEEGAYNIESQIFDALFNFSGGASKVSEAEMGLMQDRAKTFAEMGLTPQEAILKYKGFNISEDINLDEVEPYITIGDNLGEKIKPSGYESTVSKYINKGDIEGLNTYVNRLVDKEVQSIYKNDSILSANYNNGITRTNELIDLISRNKDKIGAFDSRVEDFIQKLSGTPDYQKIKTLLQMSQADMRKYFAGSAVTETEMKALQDFIGGTTKMNPDNLITMLNTLQEDRTNLFNEQRIGLQVEPTTYTGTTPITTEIEGKIEGSIKDLINNYFGTETKIPETTGEGSTDITQDLDTLYNKYY